MIQYNTVKYYLSDSLCMLLHLSFVLTLYSTIYIYVFCTLLYPLLTYIYRFILHLYTKEILQYRRNLDVVSDFSTILAYSLRSKDI